MQASEMQINDFIGDKQTLIIPVYQLEDFNNVNGVFSFETEFIGARNFFRIFAGKRHRRTVTPKSCGFSRTLWNII